MVQIAQLASTAHTAKPVSGKKIKGRVARVGLSPYKRPRVARQVGSRSRSSGVGRPAL